MAQGPPWESRMGLVPRCCQLKGQFSLPRQFRDYSGSIMYYRLRMKNICNIIILIMYVGSGSSRDSRMRLETVCDQLKSQVVMPNL